MGATYLCDLDDLQDPGSKGLTVDCDGRLYDVFVVRQGDAVRGYINSCPHTGAPLDWTPDCFLSIDNTHIQCAMHAALFRWQDGVCVAGPCAGDALVGIPLLVRQGRLMLDADRFCAARLAAGS